MGDRISISFRNGTDESVALFSHWGGKSFLKTAISYAKILKEEVGQERVRPLHRLEPGTVMVDFIKQLTSSHDHNRVYGNLYLCVNREGGDNSDNGHYVINLDSELDIVTVLAINFNGEEVIYKW